VNFSHSKVLEIVNGWVQKVAEGKILKVLDATSDDLRVLLLNTVYFKADWSTPFEARRALSLIACRHPCRYTEPYGSV
jgi:serine protease inhibitor